MSHDTDFFQFAAVVLKSKGHWILPVSFRMWFGTDGKVASPNHQIGWHPIFNEYAEICAGVADGQYAQDAGVSFFEHILVCTNSMAEATVQTLPVRNCVVCSIAMCISVY